MALSSNYRWITVGKLSIKNAKKAPQNAPTFALEDFIEALTELVGSPAGRRSYQKGERRMWCEPVSDDDDYYHILVQTGDKNVSDTAYIDFDTGQSRLSEKRDSEGGHFCSHIIVKKLPDQTRKHLILIEKVPGVHFSSLKSHFNWILNKEDNHKSFDDNGTEEKYRGIVEFDGHQSKTIQDAMTSGTVLDIQFIGHQRLDGGIDEEPLIRETINEVKWTVKRTVDENGAQNLVRRSLDFVRGWEDVEQEGRQLLVRIKSESGQVRAAQISAEAEEIEAATQEALNSAFYLNELINNFETPLPQRYDQIRNDVIQKMKAKADGLLD